MPLYERGKEDEYFYQQVMYMVGQKKKEKQRISNL